MKAKEIIEASIKDIIEEIICDTEDMILEYQRLNEKQPNFSDKTLRSATFIFSTLIMDKMWNLQENENLDSEDRLNMARKAGEDIRKLIKTYTGLDSHNL